MRCDRQVYECWVAIRDGLIKAVERFIEPTCCPIQKGAGRCQLQHHVEVHSRVRDLLDQESVPPGVVGRRVYLLHLCGDLLQHRHPLFGKAEHYGLPDVGRESIDVPGLPIDVGNALVRKRMRRVDLKSSLSPDERVVVFPLMPVRDGDLRQNERRSRIPRECPLLASQPSSCPSASCSDPYCRSASV